MEKLHIGNVNLSAEINNNNIRVKIFEARLLSIILLIREFIINFYLMIIINFKIIID